MMNEKFKDNPHYQNGYFWGERTAKFIENTTYGSLEEGIRVKEELLADFEEHFNWNMENKDYAETKGTLDAFIAARNAGSL